MKYIVMDIWTVKLLYIHIVFGDFSALGLRVDSFVTQREGYMVLIIQDQS